MRKILAAFAAAIVFAAFAPPAEAAAKCIPHERGMRVIQKSGMVNVALGVLGNGSALMEVFASADSAFAVVFTPAENPQGVLCLAESGAGWSFVSDDRRAAARNAGAIVEHEGKLLRALGVTSAGILKFFSNDGGDFSVVVENPRRGVSLSVGEGNGWTVLETDPAGALSRIKI